MSRAQPDWRRSVNQGTGPSVIKQLGSYVVSQLTPTCAPIDDFYRSAREIVRIGHPDALKQSVMLGPLLLVGLVSCTEGYLRSTLGRVLRVCPVSRAHAAEQSIHLGSVTWHGRERVERGAFEHHSFTSADAIRKTLKNFLDYSLKPKGATEVALIEYDKICELRHGIVHSSMMLPGKNAIKLKVPSSPNPMSIVAGRTEVEECASVCTAVVTSLNSELFEEMCRRWAVDWPKQPNWDAAASFRRFRDIWEIFHSATDEADGAIPSQMSPRKCKNLVQRQFSKESSTHGEREARKPR